MLQKKPFMKMEKKYQKEIKTIANALPLTRVLQ